MATLFLFIGLSNRTSNLIKYTSSNLKTNLIEHLRVLDQWATFGINMSATLQIFGYFMFTPRMSSVIIEPYLSGLQGLVVLHELFLLGLGLYLTVELTKWSPHWIVEMWIVYLAWLITIGTEFGLIRWYVGEKQRKKRMMETFQDVRDVYNRLKGRTRSLGVRVTE